MADLERASQQVLGAALYLLALALFLAPAGVAAALVLLWVGFLGALLARWQGPKHAITGVARTHPLIWIAAVLALYCLAQTLLLRLLSGEGGPMPQLGDAVDWARIVVFVPAAYAIAARRERLPLLLLLALIGLIGGMLIRMDWVLLLDAPGRFLSARDGFGFGAIAFGLYSGTALLGLIVLRRRCWQDAQGRARWPRVVAWLVALALVLQGLVMTGSRGAWLAMLAGLAAVLWLQRRQGPMVRSDSVRPSTSSVRARVVLVLVGSALLALLLANSGRVLDRFAEELDTARALATGEIAYDRDSSLSLRLHAQLYGLEAWSERPWLGWGAGTTRSLMEASGELALRSPEGIVLKHLHNTYLEAAVQLGLGGLVLFLALHLGLIGLVARRLASADDASTGDSDRDCLIFLVAALVLLLVWDLFDYRLVRQDWRGYWTLLAGAALSLGLGSGLRPSARR